MSLTPNDLSDEHILPKAVTAVPCEGKARLGCKVANDPSFACHAMLWFYPTVEDGSLRFFASNCGSPATVALSDCVNETEKRTSPLLHFFVNLKDLVVTVVGLKYPFAHQIPPISSKFVGITACILSELTVVHSDQHLRDNASSGDKAIVPKPSSFSTHFPSIQHLGSFTALACGGVLSQLNQQQYRPHTQQITHGGFFCNWMSGIHTIAAVLELMYAFILSWVLRCFNSEGLGLKGMMPNLSALSAAKQGWLRLSHKTVFLVVTVLGMSHSVAAAVPVTVDLTAFTSGAGARFVGLSSASYVGRDVTIVGDHNGDGFIDYVIGVSKQNMAVIVMKRNTTNMEVDVTTLVSDQYYRVIKGPATSQTGTAVGGIGDINGDGFDDVIVGANQGTVTGRSTPGYAFAIFGTVGPFTDLVLTSDGPDSAVGFIILGPSSAIGFVLQPRSARGLGDVNGDGIADFAVSARNYKGTSTKNNAGVVWLIFGKETAFSTIDTRLVPDNFGSNGIYFTGAAASDNLGYTVMPAGDFNGDGIADFLIGAPNYDPPAVNSVTRNNAGAVYLFHGSKTALVTMDMSSFVPGTMGVRFLGAVTYDNLGEAVSSVGDVNGDGLDDIAIGASYFKYLTRTNSGVVYVIFGTTVPFTSDVDLLNFAASTVGFAIYGRSASMLLGPVAPAGDVNGDGVNDILVGGTGERSRAHIVYGQTAVRTAHVDTLTDEVMTFYFTYDAYLGFALDGGQDLNGDGIPDILLGAFAATVTAEDGSVTLKSSGAAWMIPGPLALPEAVPSVAPTIQPSALPSAAPSQGASAAPSVDPTPAPSTSPSLSPSRVPSLTPTGQPTILPTAVPTRSPTKTPTAAPSFVITTAPFVAPTASPSAEPSAYPTSMLTVAPTTVPSSTSTIAPTVAAVKNFEVAVNVAQVVNGLSKTDYDAQKAACNLTIQHTVAELVNTIPERVTDIVVEEEEEEGRRLSAASGSVRLKYRITVFDPVLTVEKLRTQLVQAAQEGKMDASLRFYAAQFGATGLNNGTFGEPQVTSAAVQRNASEQLTGVQIALVVIGVIVGLSLVASITGLILHYRQAQPSLERGGLTFSSV